MIRQATLEDLDLLTDLFEAYRKFYKKEADHSGAKIFLQERIENKESVIFIAFDENNEAVGFTQLYPLFSSTRMKRLWLLNDLYVTPTHRGKGFSKKLLAQAKTFGEETGASGVMLETAKDNEIGNHLYPSVGYELDTRFNWYHLSV